MLLLTPPPPPPPPSPPPPPPTSVASPTSTASADAAYASDAAYAYADCADADYAYPDYADYADAYAYTYAAYACIYFLNLVKEIWSKKFGQNKLALLLPVLLGKEIGFSAHSKRETLVELLPNGPRSNDYHTSTDVTFASWNLSISNLCFII